MSRPMLFKKKPRFGGARTQSEMPQNGDIKPYLFLKIIGGTPGPARGFGGWGDANPKGSDANPKGSVETTPRQAARSRFALKIEPRLAVAPRRGWAWNPGRKPPSPIQAARYLLGAQVSKLASAITIPV
jgi:hypothetical protein